MDSIKSCYEESEEVQRDTIFIAVYFMTAQKRCLSFSGRYLVIRKVTGVNNRQLQKLFCYLFLKAICAETKHSFHRRKFLQFR